ncbi:hypothetical protein AKJ09_01748 [Labilithrix luteola]|uniref:Uncharacterized protein n=1 Tax=Labilithrix luteola TaxID=1391654 RepID=A0A0K1PPN3_9BACT|nr:hypothetical protein AKJ09_01748 [Labilithrix luteola]
MTSIPDDRRFRPAYVFPRVALSRLLRRDVARLESKATDRRP